MVNLIPFLAILSIFGVYISLLPLKLTSLYPRSSATIIIIFGFVTLLFAAKVDLLGKIKNKINKNLK